MSWFYNGHEYLYQDIVHQSLYTGDTYSIPSSIYSLYQSTIVVPTMQSAINPKKNGVTLASLVLQVGGVVDWEGDTNNFYVHLWWFDSSGPWCAYDLYWNPVQSMLNDVYVNSSTGHDVDTGADAAHALKTFGKAYSLLNSGGTIHVCNNSADFSGETVTLNKSLNIDLNGSTGYFCMPKAS